ncbi:MAG: DNA polymerase III subunit beta [Ruminococcus flavefaciens]|nr:DNA polymerase III subunit beta [Ruminococcus flavefaciens]MCM1228631.1 DNA polymerase III subunit beta [Ruminococcus flavefaciens]
MKFTCNKNELSEAISSVSKAVPQKSTIQALEGIKVKVSDGEVELTAYNLEMGIKTTIKADTDSDYEFVASSRLFSEFTKKMNGEDITVEVDGNNVVRLSSNTTECSFSAISADEYPDLPVVDSQRSFHVQQSVLKSMINMTSYAVSQNESKPIFTGELFDIEDGKFTLVAIDGFRLAIRTEETGTSEKYHFVVPKKALQEVSTLIREDADEKECTISVNDRHIIFEINNFFVISRLLEGAFHNYKLSIPNSCKTEVFVNKKDFASSLERCSLIVDDKNKSPVRCEVSGGVMKISCKTSIGRVSDAIGADIKGEGVTIGFNHKLVLEALRAAEGDKVRIRFNGAMKVIEILPPMGEDYIFLVMPIQLRG